MVGILRAGIGSFVLAATLRCPLFAQPGIISTVMGAYPLGDGLPAQRASLVQIGALAIDLEGRLLINEPHRIRRVEADGRMSTVLGTGLWWDGPLRPGPPREFAPDQNFFLQLMTTGPSGEIINAINFPSEVCASQRVPTVMIMRFDLSARTYRCS